MALMDPTSDPGPRFGPSKLEQARCAGLAVDAHPFGAATLLTCDELPRDISLNRAFDVDAREPGVPAAIVAHTRRTGRKPLLEIDLDSLGDPQRGELAALGLARLWPVAGLRIDLRALPPVPASIVSVRAVLPPEAETFGALAVRAYGFSDDRDAHTRTWTAYCALGRARCFFAEIDGVPCAIGLLVVLGDEALVDGAATLPEHRGQGCQTALLAHRLRAARAAGASVAISRTASGSPSQRNLERAGFRVYRRMEVWGEPGDERVPPALRAAEGPRP
jgi:GNAT superfamily N-acetyltransferase